MDLEKIDKINFRGRRLENNQNLRRINQLIKGSTSGLVMNAYLNDNLEDKQCYFGLDSFSTKRNLNLG